MLGKELLLVWARWLEGTGSCHYRRSELQESLLEAWNVDMNKALRFCEEGHVSRRVAGFVCLFKLS